MYPPPDSVYPNPVVSFDNYGNLVLEMHDPGTHSKKPERSRQLQAKMLVLNKPVQVARRRLEDMGRGHAGRAVCTRRHSRYRPRLCIPLPSPPSAASI